MQRGRDERGAAVVEFALVLPVLILFVFGIVEFGRAYSARIQLTAAVREGARAGALGGDVVAATRGGAPGLQGDRIAVTYTPTPGSTCAGSGTTTSTVASSSSTTIPTATVTARYPFQYTIPLFRSGTWSLSATGVMRCGG